MTVAGIRARPGRRRSYMELVLGWFEGLGPGRPRHPVYSPGMRVLGFPPTRVPRQALEDMYLRVSGTPAGRGFNGVHPVETLLAGVHEGRIRDGHLDVYEEGVRFYLRTGRDPRSHWSSVKDREGALIWANPDVPGYRDGSTWSLRYPEGWSPGDPGPED